MDTHCAIKPTETCTKTSGAKVPLIFYDSKHNEAPMSIEPVVGSPAKSHGKKPGGTSITGRK